MVVEYLSLLAIFGTWRKNCLGHFFLNTVIIHNIGFPLLLYTFGCLLTIASTLLAYWYLRKRLL